MGIIRRANPLLNGGVSAGRQHQGRVSALVDLMRGIKGKGPVEVNDGRNIRKDDWYGGEGDVSIDAAAEKEENIKLALDAEVVNENRYGSEIPRGRDGRAPCQRVRGERMS